MRCAICPRAIDDLRRKGAPLRQCGRASLLVYVPGDEMPLLIEMVVDLGVIGLDPAGCGTHSMRRTKPSLIYRRTKNLRAVQLLLGPHEAREHGSLSWHRSRRRLGVGRANRGVLAEPDRSRVARHGLAQVDSERQFRVASSESTQIDSG